MKKIPRIYINKKINIQQKISLEDDKKNYLVNVMRMSIGNKVYIFNNTNFLFLSEIIQLNKKKITLNILTKEKKNNESPLKIHLGQSISKKKSMSWIIQKSSELGVESITPIICEKSSLKNKQIINIKKWKKISISASQQCERNVLTKIFKPIKLNKWIFSLKDYPKIIFTPNKKTSKKKKLPNKTKKLYILIGSEMGFSKKEIKFCVQKKFFNINLGKRILRTETAALTAISIMQYKYGDLNV
ncbi:16S rRNA (uracil(1498)-N(3))-methyltransferase [Buchnera aphidicola]|uniref:16S rRNA (uracil(1498)-N(3))-methyltransferase n=1 Tax=Buchnera aphidicola TaxID=9 RepID=UPI0020935E61|nr:16S rRNA (uracil(1498)-N(3))-methyltransferase [Buchnera aphidicola]USS94393.1 16S rRNA (uracil(1498)-N(3))-methyltransferase [Buchnera aphidicola (Sipha maydis)]